MAFAFTVNSVQASVNAGILQLKTLLKAAGWTVPQSGDGLAAGPSGDVLTTSTYGGALANGLGTLASWFRIVAPNGREFIFQQTNPSHNDDWIVRYAYAGGFVNSGDGAPSPTVAPTGSEEVIILGTNRTGTNNGEEFTGTAAGAQVWDYCIGGAAEGYAFYAACRPSPGGNYCGGIMLDVLTNTEAGDGDPAVVWCWGNEVSTVQTLWHSARVREARWASSAKFPDHVAITGASFPMAFQRTPATERVMWSVMIGDLALASSGVEILNASSFNIYDGDFDVIAGVDWFHCADDATYQAPPTGKNPGSARGAYKGRSRLLAAVSGTGLNAMDTDTGLTKVYQPGLFGALWLIWDGATTPIL